MPGQDGQVAEYDATGITFTADFNELMSFSEEQDSDVTVLDDQQEVVEIENKGAEEESQQETEEEEVVEEQEDEVTDKNEESQEQEEEVDEYSDYTDVALVALKKVRSGEWDLEEKDIPKDMDPVLFDELVLKNEEMRFEAYKDSVLNQVQEYGEYVKYLIEGGSPQVLQQALTFNDLKALDVTNAEDQTTIITEFYKSKGVSDEDIPDLIESILDRGQGEQRAKVALNAFEEYEKNVLQNEKVQREEQKRLQQEQIEQYKSSITNLVDSGEVAGYKLSKKQQKDVISAMFDQTELIKTADQNGRMVSQKITRAHKLMNELNSSPEKQVALTLWLLEGGDFEFAKEQAETETSNSLRDLLSRRKTTSQRRRKPAPKRETENGFDILARTAPTVIDRRI